MRTLILMGCGIVAAGLSGWASGADRIYTNDMYCFSALKPAGMNISTFRQGAAFDFGKPCGAVGDPSSNCIGVYGMYVFTDTDPLTERTQFYESEGWVLKPSASFGRVKGWREQTLIKGSDDQQKEVHIYAQPLRKSELAAQHGIVLGVGYEIVAELNSSEHKAFSKPVMEVLTGWRMLEGCDPFSQSAPAPEQ